MKLIIIFLITLTQLSSVLSFAQINKAKKKRTIITAKGIPANSHPETNEVLALPPSQRKISEDYNNRGLAYLRDNNFDSALALFDLAIAADTQNSASFTNKGFYLKRIDKLREAIEMFTIAIEKDSSNCNAYEGRGTCYSFNNELDEATKDAQILLNLNCSAKYHYLNAHIFNSRRFFSDAITELETALSLEPYYEPFLIEICYSLSNLKQWQREITYANSLIQVNSKSRNGYYNLAEAYRKLGNYEQAYLNINTAIAVNSNDYDCYLLKSAIELDLKLYTQAIETGLHAVQLSVKPGWAYNNIAIAYSQLDDLDKACQYFYKAYLAGLSKDLLLKLVYCNW